jgi:two-component system, cell cycle sensor histidine kinase and response regulator CckA
MTKPPLRVLILEHATADAELSVIELESAGFDVRADIVGTREEYLAQLGRRAHDIVLADYRLPDWTGMDALAALQAYGWDIPFILVTGTLGEERAVECVKQGAADYILKQNLTRLTVAVRRALEECRVREERARAEALVDKLTQALDQSPASVIITDAAGSIEYVNQRFTEVTGYTREESLGRNPRLLKSGETPADVYHDMWRTLRSGGVWQGEIQNRTKGGDRHLHAVTIAPVRDPAGTVTHFVATQEDISARKAAERELREREERFRQLAENIREVFFVMDAGFQETLYINPAYEEIWGRSRRSLYENPGSFIHAVPAEDRAPLLANIERMQRGEEVGEIEFRVIRPDGQTRWVMSHAAPVRNEQGEIYRIIGVAQDVTGRRLAEQALREREEQLRLLLDSTGEGIYGLDHHGRCTFCNQAAARLLGYERPEELVGQNMHELSHHTRPDGSPYPAEECPILLAFHRHQAAHVQDEEFWRADGTSFPVEYWSYPIRRDGTIIGAVATFMDITERRRVQEALEDSEALFRKLTEASFDGIALTDSGVVTTANRGFAAMFGYTLEEVIGRPVLDFIAEESRDDVRRQIADNLEGTYELVGQRKDGRKVFFEATARMHNTRGRRGRLTALRDMTEKRALENQFHQAQKMEAVGRLAGGVAHDFNNQLTVITAYAHMLLDDLAPGDPQREDLDQISQAAVGAAALTRQLLAFSRQEVIEPRLLDLDEGVRAAQKMLRRLIGEDIEMVTLLTDDPPTVKIDPGQLEQIIMNLAVNARDAMPTGGTLSFETATVSLDEASARQHWLPGPGWFAVLSVSDTGIGIAEGTRARIFEPFFTTKETGKGTGLGLSTVYGIVKQSGGSIEVESEPGCGTTFRIYLPRLDEPAERIMAAGAGLPPRGTETVFLVEDAPAVRRAICEILERCGYTVLEAPGAQPALALAAKRREPIHLLLTDVVMPGMSGRELAERFTRLHPEAKVLYMSGYADDATVRHQVRGAETSYVQKPFSPDTLARKVRDAIASPNAS